MSEESLSQRHFKELIDAKDREIDLCGQYAEKLISSQNKLEKQVELLQKAIQDKDDEISELNTKFRVKSDEIEDLETQVKEKEAEGVNEAVSTLQAAKLLELLKEVSVILVSKNNLTFYELIIYLMFINLYLVGRGEEEGGGREDEVVGG